MAETIEKQKILVVDDLPGNIRVMTEVLGNDYEIFAATNGRNALTVVANTPPDLILLDIVMPEMDGFELCRRLQANEATRTIPIIFITSRDDRNDEWQGLTLGAVDFITRPLNPPVVKARVKTHLELCRKRVQALEAARVKSEFLATMSHEIRTPMNAILGFADLLASTSLNDKQKKYIDIILHSGHSLLHIINDILDFSKMDAGKLKLESLPFNLRELLDEIMDSFSLAVQEKGLHMFYRVSFVSPVMLRGDSYRLRQILVNLLSNSLKFTHQGSIDLLIDLVSLDTDQVILRFCVNDTGIGIAPEVRDKLFHAFSQADSSTTRKHGGTGLGLAISSRLVALMGGEIQWESTVHGGTSFHFTARFEPELQENGALPWSQAPHKLDELVKAWRILVVDDDEASRILALDLLNRLGIMDITLAESGQAGLEQWQRGHFNLVFMDGHMPGMDGFQTTQAIRQQEADGKRPRIPVVAMTADVSEAFQSASRQAGMDAFLAKPVEPHQLVMLLQRLSAAGQPMEPGLSAAEDARQPDTHDNWVDKARKIMDDIQAGIEAGRMSQVSLAAKSLVEIARSRGASRLYRKALKVLMVARSTNTEEIGPLGRELLQEFQVTTPEPTD